MGNYLVMKNNYKRLLSHRSSIGMIIAVPIIICLITFLASYIKNDSIRVGILTDDMTKESILDHAKKVMDGYEFIDYGFADAKSTKTDQIMGKYNFVLDLREQSKGEQSIRALQEIIINSGSVRKGLSSTERTVALLMTVFIILSTVHASNYIDDRKAGLLERYTFAPRRKSGYLLGYAIFTVSLVFLQAGFSLVVLVLLQPSIQITVLEGLMVIVFITLVASLIGMVFTLFSKSDMQANLCSSAFSVVMTLLGGTFMPIESMPKIFQIASLLSPIRWILGFL